jgi:ketosteroid isomerase-like protein
MTGDTATAEELMRLDRAIDDAATAGDWDALEQLLAPDFVYTHSTGAEEAREVWIEGLRRLTGQRDRVAQPAKAELHGDVAVVMGDLDIVWHTDRANAYNRYVRVYRHADGAWRAISQRTVPAYDRAP